MARRFFLVPETKYNMLLSQEQSLFDSKREADGILSDRKLTAGEKNLLYNQKLENVLKTRKEALNRPVKVKVESSDATVNQSTQTGATPPRKKKTERKPFATPKGAFYNFESSDNEFGDETSDAQEIPKNEKEAPKDVSELVDSITQYVMANKEKFLVTDKGQIMGKVRRIVKGSDAVEAISHLFEPPLGGTPAGYKTLRTRILSMPETRELIDHFESTWGRSVPQFTPKTWKY